MNMKKLYPSVLALVLVSFLCAGSVSAQTEVPVLQSTSQDFSKILYPLPANAVDLGTGVAWATTNYDATQGSKFAANNNAKGPYYAPDEVTPPADWRVPVAEDCELLTSNETYRPNALLTIYSRISDASIQIRGSGYHEGANDAQHWGNSYPDYPYMLLNSWGNDGTQTLLIYSAEFGDLRYGHLGQYFSHYYTVRLVYDPVSFNHYIIRVHIGGQYIQQIHVAEGERITLVATPLEGHSFRQWGHDTNATDPRLTITVTGNADYYANFDNENYGPDGGGGGDEQQPEDEEETMSPDASVSVWQNVTRSTMKIVYDLSPKTGRDGYLYTPVDLGYGVAWADRNVGAYSPNEVGEYFRWGDPVADVSFSSDVCLPVEGYQTYDRLTPEQDAATVNIGTAWRMPDEEDYYNLKTNSVISNGNTFTNASDPSLSIVFPAGGYMGTQLYDAGYQYYWSRQYSKYGRNSCSNQYGYSPNEHTCFAFVRCTDGQYYVQNRDKDDCYGNEPYLGMPVRAMYDPSFAKYTLTVRVGSYTYQFIAQAGQNVVVTAVPNTGYVFDRWTEDGNTDATRTFTVTGNMTYTATFKQATTYHTVTVTASPAGYGTVDVPAVTNVPHGTNITVNGSQATIYNTTVTATPAANDAQYTYTFTGWTNAPATVNSDLTVTANFTRTTRTYTVTIAEVENGTVVVKNGDNVVANGSEVPYGTTLTVVATPAENYEFSAWTSGTPALDGNGQFTLTGSVTIGATFTALPEEPEEPETDKLSVTLNEVIFVYGEVPNQQVIETAVMSVTDGTTTYTYDPATDNLCLFPTGAELTFTLQPTDPVYDYGEFISVDDDILATGLTWTTTLTEDMDVYAWCGVGDLVWEDKAPSDFADYDAYYSYMMRAYAGKPIHRLAVNRIFTANAWGCVCLPIAKMNIEGSAIYNMVYGINKAYTNAQKTTVTVDFAVTNIVESGMPYLIKCPSQVEKPYFEYVMLDPDAQPHRVNAGGNVDFVGVLNESVVLAKGDRSVRYVASNKLYYPNSKKDVTISPNRAYFEITNFNVAVPMRMCVSVEGETLLDDAEAPEEEGLETLSNSEPATKVILDGVLYIFRNGTCYDAQGHRL